MDEASMVSNPDLADVIGQAAAVGAKMILAGDTQQLQAVENGGGLSLLVGALGYAQLTDPVRFQAAWEQQASLRLRAGDASVLAEYDQHGRIRGGTPEQMMDAAAAAYLALALDGTDTLLMAADHTLRRELNRRIREDLITLSIVQDGLAVTIADGTRASAGDLIICTRNDHSVEAGEPGRTLANGDLLRIDAVTAEGLLVRRALDADPATGCRRWTDRHFVVNSYQDAELGYAVTDHAAQSRTVTAGLAVITGTEDRQHAYVALSRGTEINLAYVFTASPRTAEPAPGPRPAPELARYDRRATRPRSLATPTATMPGEALAVLAGVLDRDGEQQSATQTRTQALADMDHLAVMHAIWTAETTPARDQAYHDLLMNNLPPGYRRPPGHQAKWLWRTLRAAELAGLDPARPGRRDRRTGPGRLSRHCRRSRHPPAVPPRFTSPGPAWAGQAQEYRRRAREIAERLGMTVLLERLVPLADEWRLARDGEDWVLEAGDERARLRDGRGLHYLRSLLAAPGREIRALDLVARGAGLAASGMGPALDAAARNAYRTRLDVLTARLDAADRVGDRAAAEEVEAERHAVLVELRRAVGLGDRGRMHAPEAERARVNATRTLRATIERMAAAAPGAAGHLRASIRTGAACRYEPAPGGPSRWHV
jgi:AAA domain-containing protein